MTRRVVQAPSGFAAWAWPAAAVIITAGVTTTILIIIVLAPGSRRGFLF